MNDEPIVISYEGGDQDEAASDLDQLLAFLREHGEADLDPYQLQKPSPGVTQEPITVGLAVIAGSLAAGRAIVKALERWASTREETRQEALKAGAEYRHRNDADLRITIRRGLRSDVLTVEEYSAEVGDGEPGSST